jgi:hypothetical protein
MVCALTLTVAFGQVTPDSSDTGSTVVTNLSQASLETALALNMPVTFAVSGVIPFERAIVLTHDAALDGTGRSITTADIIFLRTAARGSIP